MTRSALPRPLLALTAASLALGATAAVPSAAASVRAVVSFDGAAVTVPGVRVVDALPALRMAVVVARPAALVRLSHTAGVRAVRPDSAVRLAGGATDEGPAVRASAGLGGQAGKGDAGRGVRVAVLDTGVSDTAVLNRASGRLIDAFDSAAASAAGPLVDAPLTDGHGHGTFMASLIAGGPSGAQQQPVGVAPGATVLVVRVAESDGSTRLSQVLAGLDWVAAHPDQVDVANLSLSHARPGSGYGADPLTDAVEAVRDAGVTIVVSSGNDPSRVGDPGFAPKALTVGAVDLSVADVEVADFSGSADVAGVRKPDVVANGVHVLGALPPDSLIARENPASRVGELWRGSGTSQAAAVTSGVAALLLEKRPDATPAQVKGALRQGARQLAGDRDGSGLLRVVSSLGKGRGSQDGNAGPGAGDPTGEGSLDANSWSANSWSANSWSANSWSANSWSANSWSANSWSANSWSGGNR